MHWHAASAERRRGPAARLVYGNLGIAYSVAERRRRGDEDVRQAALLGLIEAARSWDEERAPFAAHAFAATDWAVLKHLRRERSLVSRLGQRRERPVVLSLDAPGPDGRAMLDTLPGGLAPVDVSVEESELLERLKDVIESLPPAERSVIRLLSEGETLSSIGAKLGLGAAWVQELRRRGAARLAVAVAAR